MNQSLHILRKDVRHLWPEISLHALLLIVFAWAAPQLWIGADNFNSMLQILVGLLRAILPIVWLVMVGRLIQDESLVGDQQFWITRPYTWQGLLGAKVMFVAAFILVPFAAMQCYLLVHAGLHPFSVMPQFGMNLAYISVMLLIFAGVATVTSTFPRMATTLIGSLIAIVIALVILGNKTGMHKMPPLDPALPFTVFAVLLLALVIYQYVTRDTKRSRIWLGALPVLLGIMIFAAPANMLFNHYYPASTESSAERLTFDPDPAMYEKQTGKIVSFGGNAFITLPVQLQGVDSSHLIGDSGMFYTVDAPGFHYQSPWMRASFGRRAMPAVMMPQKVAERFPQGTPAHLHVTAVADLLQAGTPQTATVSERFAVPNNGFCVQPEEGGGNMTICRYAFANAVPTRFTANVSATPCRMAAPTHPSTAELPVRIQVPAFDPVSEERLQLSNGGFLCSGTQASVTSFGPSGSIRAEVDVPATPLAPYIARRPEPQGTTAR